MLSSHGTCTPPDHQISSQFTLILLPKRSAVGAAFMMFNILDCAHSVRKFFFPNQATVSQPG